MDSTLWFVGYRSVMLAQKRGGHEMLLTAYMDTTSGTKKGRIRESDWSEPNPWKIFQKEQVYTVIE
jgi:hypothetical protein